MTWSLFSEDKFQKPLCFSNGKTQQDIVNEILEFIKEGKKIIFIHGVCGTGKSAIALNLARKLGKTAIVVPNKNLQHQYQLDYENKKYIKKPDGKKLKIKVITGRKNHQCVFLENNFEIPKEKKEIDSNLEDIFYKPKEKLEEDNSADNSELPCKIEIKEKNLWKIKQYLKENPDIDIKNFSTIQDVKRVSVAGACPYWSPSLPSRFELKGKSFLDAEKKKYRGINGEDFIFYQRKRGCGFYEQFHSYVDSDVIVFNSLKYQLEHLLGRKPKTDLDVIDECDEFLDSFSNKRLINLERLEKAITNHFTFNENDELIWREIKQILKQIKNSEQVKSQIINEEVVELKRSGIYDLLKIFIKNPEIMDLVDEESYLFNVERIAKEFESFLDESFVLFSKKEDQVLAEVITVNLEKKLKQILEKNKIVVMMSGTLHSEYVLKNIFGLKDFQVVEAEVEQQGEIKVKRTGLEKDFRYSNFSNRSTNREEYLIALNKCLENCEKPCLVHVNSFGDLPSKEEKQDLKLNELITREELRDLQQKDKKEKRVQRFKEGQIDLFFSTKASRGLDFPGEECKSIIFTKYPNPDVKDLFWRILAKTKPQFYWEFYKDKARRELIQKVYRGLRSKEDSVFVLSPDLRVLDFFERGIN